MSKYSNIMVAVDGSDSGKISFEKAVQLVKENQAKLTIVHIAEVHPSYYTPFEEETSVEFGKKVLAEHESIAKDAGLQVETVLRVGSPKQIIPRELAKELNVDLIVCGSQGLNAIEHFFLGSVSESIARHAPCDVLIVRNK